MSTVPLSHALLLAGGMFAIGLTGVLVRRNLLFLMMSLEVMLNAAALAFVAAGSRWLQPDGQIMFVLILSLAAAEVAVGLALVLQIHRHIGVLDTDAVDALREPERSP